jgi:hypothetical protein
MPLQAATVERSRFRERNNERSIATRAKGEALDLSVKDDSSNGRRCGWSHETAVRTDSAAILSIIAAC